MKTRLEYGLTPAGSLDRAWTGEPLTSILPELDVTVTMPPPDKALSLIAKNESGEIIGQCMAVRTVKIWEYLANVDDSKFNSSTRTLVALHKKSVADEQSHLNQLDEDQVHSIHSAGIAILPEYRGQGVGEQLRQQQIETCVKQKATTLFCMTTNYFSAMNVKKSRFEKIAEYPYQDLAVELSCDDLKKVEGEFSVWCRKL